jgi:hypothetical protein
MICSICYEGEITKQSKGCNNKKCSKKISHRLCKKCENNIKKTSNKCPFCREIFSLSINKPEEKNNNEESLSNTTQEFNYWRSIPNNIISNQIIGQNLNRLAHQNFNNNNYQTYRIQDVNQIHRNDDTSMLHFHSVGNNSIYLDGGYMTILYNN